MTRPHRAAPVNSAVYACDLSNTPAALAQRLPVSILLDPEQAPKSTGEVNATFNATIQVECSLRPARLSTWQMGAFLMIKSAYEARWRAFEDDLAARQRDLRVHNPLLLRQIVREQLVQAAISEFAKSTLPLPDMGVFTPPDHEPRYARFLRDAFDWDGMSVEVYGESQPDAFMDEGQTALIALYDPSLSLVEFLRASQARLLVAARPEAARPLLLALRIGEIWPCAPDLTPCMAGDEAIVDQIIAGEGERERDDGPGDRWSIIIPTSMVALASDDPFR